MCIGRPRCTYYTASCNIVHKLAQGVCNRSLTDPNTGSTGGGCNRKEIQLSGSKTSLIFIPPHPPMWDNRKKGELDSWELPGTVPLATQNQSLPFAPFIPSLFHLSPSPPFLPFLLPPLSIIISLSPHNLELARVVGCGGLQP